MRLVAAVFGMALLISCGSKRSPSEFAKVRDAAVYRLLSFSPVAASGQGLHKWNGQDFDTALDDLSQGTIRRQREGLLDLHKQLNQFDPAALAPEDAADLNILDGQIALALFDSDVVESGRHSPQSYVELLGTALFNPRALDYAPLDVRYRHIIARLEKTPHFLEVARGAVWSAPPDWIKVAAEENEGNIALVDKDLRNDAPAALKGAYAAAASPALDALRNFSRFLKEDLPKRGRSSGGPDWRLGAANYATKFKLALATDRTPEQVLADAQARLNEVRAKMLEIAAPLHAQWFPAHPGHPDSVIREVLDHIAQERSTPGTYMDDSRAMLTTTRDFVQAKKLLSLPAGSNLQVIATPEFLRGIYSVGGFSPAPVLEPQLGAFFWITPVPETWTTARIDSKLREYNKLNLQLFVIHEAMPGHYVQGEFANTVEPKTRRILRAAWGNGPYVEGWAQYITQVMLDEGYLNRSPELRLTLYKQELRVDANAILDISLQAKGMTDQQAMELMENQAFQEHEEAVGKLQRAKLSSTQLPTYFVGWRDWLRVRELAKQKAGFNLHEFHDKALREGAVPLPVLARLLTGKDLQ